MEKIVIQGKNGGFLTAGNPGNKGGTGRPPNELRLKNRLVHEKALAKAEELLDGEQQLSDTFLTNVLNATGRYGLGEAKTVVPAEVADALGSALSELDIAEDVKAKIIDRTFEKLSQLG